MKTPETTTPPETTTYACTVLITPTTIGDLICGAGHKIRLPKSEAEALAAMNPPRVSIDGI